MELKYFIFFSHHRSGLLSEKKKHKISQKIEHKKNSTFSQK